jgi:hypothetical protein
MNASLVQQVEFGRAYLTERGKEYETMKVAMTSMDNELRLAHQQFKALTEGIAVSYAVEQR